MTITIIAVLLITIAFLIVKMRKLNSGIEALRKSNPFDINQDGKVDNKDLSEYMKGFNKSKE